MEHGSKSTWDLIEFYSEYHWRQLSLSMVFKHLSNFVRPNNSTISSSLLVVDPGEYSRL